MTGTPSEAEIQTQWKAAVNILETMRAHVDGTHAGSGGLWDTLEQAVKGEYTPQELTRFTNAFRATCSDLISPQRAAQVLTPVLFEYAARIDSDAATTQGFGSGKRTVSELFRALYDWFHANSYSVKSRAISYDTSATTSGTGNGVVKRLTVDENAYNLEACHAEKKRFKCVSDRHSGVNEHAEVFEVIGEASSFDSVQRASFGSGTQANTTIVSKNAGSGAGGSILTNSSFSTYDSGGSPKFTGWTEDSGSANITQNTGTTYRSHPGASTDASLEFTGNAKVSQALTAMRVRRLDPDTPYLLRVMFNRQSSCDGTLSIRMGSHSVDVSLSAQSGWTEAVVALDENCWFRTFNEDGLDVEIELASNTTGSLLIDDVIFAPFDLIDGTYWWMTQNNATPTSWLVDDALVFTDTETGPASAKLQWWLWVAGVGYLPSSGTPTVTDP